VATTLSATMKKSMKEGLRSGYRKIRSFVRSHLVAATLITITSSFALTSFSALEIYSAYNVSQSLISETVEINQSAIDLSTSDESIYYHTLLYTYTGDSQYLRRYKELITKLDKSIKYFTRKDSPALQQAISKIDGSNRQLLGIETRAFQLVKNNQLPSAQQLVTGSEYNTERSQYQKFIYGINEQITKFVADKTQAYRQQMTRCIFFATAILPILMVSWLVLLLAIQDYISAGKIMQINLQEEITRRRREQRSAKKESKLIQQDVSVLLDAVSAMELGDLTTRVPMSEGVVGLVGDTLNRLTEELSRIIYQAASTAQQVGASSYSRQQMATQVVMNTTEQAKSAQSVQGLTREVRGAAQAAVRQVSDTNNSLLSLQNTIAHSQDSIRQLDRNSNILQQGSDRVVQQIKTLGEFLGQTDRFIQDQTEISTQTQILALNASLVAARAAEQQDPSQFAAVAREFESIADRVSELAQQNSVSLTDLEQRSSQIDLVVSTIDREVQDLGGFVRELTQEVKAATTAFDVVQTVTRQAVESGETVSRTSQDILNATDLTAAAMDGIVSLAQEIATQARDAQRAGVQLNQLSYQLIGNIQVFKLPEEILPSDMLIEAHRSDHFTDATASLHFDTLPIGDKTAITMVAMPDFTQICNLAETAIVQGQQKMTTLLQSLGDLQQGTGQIANRTQSLEEFIETATQFSREQKRVAALTKVLAFNAALLSTRAIKEQDPAQFNSIAHEFEAVASQVSSLAVSTNLSLRLLQQRTTQIQTVTSGLNEDLSEMDRLLQKLMAEVGSSQQEFTTAIDLVAAEVTTLNKSIAPADQNRMLVSSASLN
jgi:methyl-accepting chemotaxis protein PixJ